MVGLIVFPFVLHVAAALLAKTPPKDEERRAAMLAFAVLAPTLLTQPLPPTVLPLLSLFSPLICTGRVRVMAAATVHPRESGTLGEL